MSSAKKCDRCGNLFEPFFDDIYQNPKGWRYSVIKDCYPYKSIEYDLCLRCKKELCDWVEKYKESDNEKG